MDAIPMTPVKGQLEILDAKERAMNGSAEPLLRQKQRHPLSDESPDAARELGSFAAPVFDARASTSSSDVEPSSSYLEHNSSYKERTYSPTRTSVNSVIPSGPFCSCARPEAAVIACSWFHNTYGWTTGSQVPIVYHDRYNITFWGLEKMSQYDSFKFQKVMKSLVDKGLCTAEMLLTPVEATNAMLAGIHSEEYLTKISTTNWKVMQVCEINSLLMVPPILLQWNLIYPLRLMAGGTVLAAGVALQRGWAINLGGGMHHANFNEGMGWCAFNDITLAVHRVREATQGMVKKVLYIDLDAHQGNGVALNKLHFNDQDLYILDMFNSWIYPHDTTAHSAINIAVELAPQTKDQEYLDQLQAALRQCAAEFQPDLIMYNAGADVLSGDSTGRLCVTEEGLIRRDEMVFEFALVSKVPVCMTLAGGYASMSAECVARSIANLFDKFGLGL